MKHPPLLTPPPKLDAHSGPCLLLDVSGSMADGCGDGKRSRLAALQAIVKDFAQTRQFSFSDSCTEAPPLYAGGSTDLAGAFYTIKARGVRQCILITDGLPDSANDALAAARGLSVDIIYVGPQPAPAFLAQLAKATGGMFEVESLARTQIVTQKVQHLLLDDKQRR